MEPLTVLVLTLFLIVTGLYLFIKWRYSYWRRHGVYHLEPKFPFGNIESIAKRIEFFGDSMHKFHQHFRSKGVKGGGYYMFLKPMYMPVDISLVKDILQKDFSHFVNRGRYVNKELNPLSGNLFSIENEEWRQIRIKLTPTFTSAKMKQMFQTFVACTSELINIINESAMVGDPIEIRDVVSRFTTDIIGSCAFGIDCNSLKNPNSEFRKYGKQIFKIGEDWTKKLNNFLILALPTNLLTLLGIKDVDEDVERFFMDIVQSTVNYREKNYILRNDFLQLLIRLKNEGEIDDENDNMKKIGKSSQTIQALSLKEMTAHCFSFFIAGYETSASTMTFALFELALNNDIQVKLRNEIERVIKNHQGNITYGAVVEMIYLDHVVNETLRKYAPGSIILRACNKAYHVPGTTTVLEPNTDIRISVLGIHHDPEYYPNPDKFDPDRFTEENKSKRPSCSFLAFGEGPRNCIGARFGLLQTKVGLLSVIRNFEVTLNERTKVPIQYDPNSIVTAPKEGVWLNVTRIEVD